MDKIGLKRFVSQAYNQQNFDRVVSLIEQQINRAADGYLFPAVRVTSAYTMTLNDAVILVDASAGAVTVTLKPALDWEQKRVTVKKIDSSGNAVIVDANGAETIDGAANKSIPTQYTSFDFISEGGSVHII
jgi:hypothetical protein